MSCKIGDTLDEVVPAKVRDHWLNQLMREKYPEPMTILEWLRRPPRKRSRKTLDEEISKWLVIRAMTPPMGLDRIPAQRLRAYARRMRRRRPIKVREIAEPRRTLELAALLSVTAARQSDTVLRLIEMRIAEIWSWAHAVARPEPRQHLPEEVACELARVMDDTEVSDAEYRERSRILLAPWRAGARQARRSRAAQVREHLAANARRVRPLLKHIITLRSAEHRTASRDRCAGRAGQLLPRRLHLPVLRANLAGGACLERAAACVRS